MKDFEVVEVGFLLDGELEKYEQILEKAGAENTYSCETHDWYWTNVKAEKLFKMTENQIKNSCIRLRECAGFDGVHWSGNNEPGFHFDNISILDDKKAEIFNKLLTEENFDKVVVSKNAIKAVVQRLEEHGWYLIFDTFKRDYQYKIGEMQSRIQLQEIDNIGLVLYYDNPDFYGLSAKNQRNNLIDELNSYGFEFNYNDLGIDKLRTLLVGTSQFSENQNS